MIKPITPKLKNYHTKGVNRRFASLLSLLFCKVFNTRRNEEKKESSNVMFQLHNVIQVKQQPVVE